MANKPLVFVGMSGGVDSSVSALILKEQGYQVIGVYMKNWSKDLPGMKCPWAEDLADAKRVAVKLGIDFEVWDFEEAYREKVVEYMLREFRAGNTPNPDVMCNQEIKFKLFYEKAMGRGADFIATGHYARVLQQEENTDPSSTRSLRPVCVSRDGTALFGKSSLLDFLSLRCSVVTGGASLTPLPVGRGRSRKDSIPLLARAVDENKDQTYFLYRISEEALAHTIFPIGEMLKPEVKKLAEKNGLHNAYKKESMGVCFVGEVGMKDFLKEYIDIRPGEIREIESEKVLGYHEGAVFYTIGQRHGLYLNGIAGEMNDGLPYYVVKKDIENNVVYVSKNLNDEHIWTKKLELKDVFVRQLQLSDSRLARSDPSVFHETELPCSENQVNLIFSHFVVPSLRAELRSHRSPLVADGLGSEIGVAVRLRHRAPLIPAKIMLGENGAATLEFENEIKRPAAGQSAVIYDGEICLGGGIIK